MEILFVVAKPYEACLYTMTIPMYLAWNVFLTCKLQRVIRQLIFLIHYAPSSPNVLGKFALCVVMKHIINPYIIYSNYLSTTSQDKFQSK